MYVCVGWGWVRVDVAVHFQRDLPFGIRVKGHMLRKHFPTNQALGGGDHSQAIVSRR